MKRSLMFLCLVLIFFIGGNPLYSVPPDASELVKDIAEGMREAYRDNPELSIGSRSCAVGSFTWSDSGIGTAFSEYLRLAAGNALMDVQEFDLVVPPEGTAFFRGAAGQLLAEDSENRAEDLPASAYRIFGSYAVEDQGVTVDLGIYSEIFSRLMADFSITVPLDSLPRGIELYPENKSIVTDVSAEVSGLYSGAEDFQVFLTTNRGEGGVFRNGEYLKLYLLSSQDCYVKLYHIDINGKTTLIFPNRYEKNNYLPGREILEFPGKRSPFQFKIVPPYGTETVKVVASTKQFTSLEEDFKNLGYATRGLFIEEVKGEAREVMAENLVHFTILRSE